ncbi:MAG: hypothetical protein H6835_15515 [Planctomycetes bacterium]|nr:hypothetical protein [Planctomycetota bacterium]
MTTMAMEIARERQLDWLLGEVFGSESRAARGVRVSRPWLAAALIVLGAGVAFGVAALRGNSNSNGNGNGNGNGNNGNGNTGIVAPIDAPQQPAAPIPWIECHGEAKLGDVPADVTALRCFDFTDAGVAGLARFTNLTHLDLSGMDVDSRGYGVASKITDAGVEKLAALTRLRWLSLAECHDVQGKTLGALRAIPQLEHLDLTFTGLRSEGIAQLPELPSLRELTLSHCMDFHGRSLADVAKLPGLRRLELRGCSTVKADDVEQLAALHELRHLDLRDCMGAFRGQTMQLEDITNGPPPDAPTHDSIGVTDGAIAALVGLPLETLLLDGCRSLTDGVADSIDKLKTLRAVGLGELPNLTMTTLQALPKQLRELSLDGSRQLGGPMLFPVEQLPMLEVLSLCGLEKLTDGWLWNLTREKPLRVLRIGGTRRMGDATGPDAAFRPDLTAAGVAKVLAGLPTLEELDASYSVWFDADVAAAAARLPRLRQLNLTGARIAEESLAALAASTSLRELALIWAQGVTVPALERLSKLPLRELDLYGCRDLKAHYPNLFVSGPDARVRLPDGSYYGRRTGR